MRRIKSDGEEIREDTITDYNIKGNSSRTYRRDDDE